MVRVTGLDADMLDSINVCFGFIEQHEDGGFENLTENALFKSTVRFVTTAMNKEGFDEAYFTNMLINDPRKFSVVLHILRTCVTDKAFGNNEDGDVMTKNNFKEPLKVSNVCKVCGKRNNVIVEKIDFQKWQIEGEYIQNALPYLSADEREILVSGTCPPCWDKLYKGM